MKRRKNFGMKGKMAAEIKTISKNRIRKNIQRQMKSLREAKNQFDLHTTKHGRVLNRLNRQGFYFTKTERKIVEKMIKICNKIIEETHGTLALMKEFGLGLDPKYRNKIKILRYDAMSVKQIKIDCMQIKSAASYFKK